MVKAVVPKVHMTSPFPVAEYIASSPYSSDAKRFSAMYNAGSFERFPNRTGIRRLTESGGLRKRWYHSVGRSFLETVVPHATLEILYKRA